MSVGLSVDGFRPADERWNQMKVIWDACVEANIPVPDKVAEFFDYEDPGDKPGISVTLKDACYEFGNDYQVGYEIDITKLPEGIRYIRAYLS